MRAYCDADFAASQERKPTMAYVFIQGEGAVGWMSEKERTIAASTAEEEYMALLKTVVKGKYLDSAFLERVGDTSSAAML